MTMDALILFFLLLFNSIILLSIGTIRNRTERKLKRIEYYVELIVDHLEIDRFPKEIKEIALDPDPRQRLKAVSLYTKRTGATFQEAVEAIEKLSSRKFRS